MGRLWEKAAYCKYKQNDRKLKRLSLNGTNDEAITTEIIKDLMGLKDTSELSSEGQNSSALHPYRKTTHLQYCGKIPQLGHIKNLQNNKTYNTLRNGTCQSNKLIYCLECNWCHVKYIGQTKNRITDRFWGHIFDIKHSKQHHRGKTFSQPQWSIWS